MQTRVAKASPWRTTVASGGAPWLRHLGVCRGPWDGVSDVYTAFSSRFANRSAIVCDYAHAEASHHEKMCKIMLQDPQMAATVSRYSRVVATIQKGEMHLP